jgi:predicted dehydrogenase
MIEKPLAANVEEARDRRLGRHGVVVAVGHSERCNPVVQAMKRLKIEPKFIEAVRISPFPFRSMEVSVVLDLMIHDIDIVLSLANSPIAAVDAVGVNVIADHEDICSARIRFANGCVANITASRLAMKTERKIRVFSRQAYLSLDFLKKEGTIIKADPNVDVVRWIQEQRNNPEADFTGVNWTELLHIENLSIENNEPLRVEQEAFLNAVRGTVARPEVTAEEGLAAMECAEKILARSGNLVGIVLFEM